MVLPGKVWDVYGVAWRDDIWYGMAWPAWHGLVYGMG